MPIRIPQIFLVLVILFAAGSARAQWSASAMSNLALTGKGSDKVQPKIKATSDGGWFISYFYNNPIGIPPGGYDVYVQRLDAGGVLQLPPNGIRVADLGLSSTTDYGFDLDSSGDALIAFQDDRENANIQITAARVGREGKLLWGPLGVQLTSNLTSFNASPKITGTSDGGSVVAWISDATTMLQKLDANGKVVWANPVVLSEAGANYGLADLHGNSDGSVIVSFTRDTGFGSPRHLLANKISASGQLLWGARHVSVFDGGSLQFGNYPTFAIDLLGGAVFSWYSSTPSLQTYAQHILTDGSEAFPHNGSVGSSNANQVRVEPSATYITGNGKTIMFWTEEDMFQFTNGVSGQMFDATGVPQWGANGQTIVPLGSASELFVRTVFSGTGAFVFWVNEPAYGQDTIQGVRVNSAGKATCSQFTASSLPTTKSRPQLGDASTGLNALVWEDSRNGNVDLYAQSVNGDCSLGYPALTCSNVHGLSASCSQGNLTVAVNMSNFIQDGNYVSIQINAVSQPVQVNGHQAILTVPGAGINTVQVINPAGCLAPRTISCP